MNTSNSKKDEIINNLRNFVEELEHCVAEEEVIFEMIAEALPQEKLNGLLLKIKEQNQAEKAYNDNLAEVHSDEFYSSLQCYCGQEFVTQRKLENHQHQEDHCGRMIDGNSFAYSHQYNQHKKESLPKYTFKK